MSRNHFRNRLLPVLLVGAMLVCLLPAIGQYGTSANPPPTIQQGSEFRGQVIISVPPPPYEQGPYYSGPLTTEEWIEQVEYIGADGISMGMERWWDNIPLYQTELQKYKDAGFLVTLGWDSHGAPNYNLRFNPPLHYWSMDNQHKQGVHYWRVFINSSSPEVEAFRYGYWPAVNDPTIVQNGDGSVTVKVANLDYYTPVYGGGATYNISSVYDQYPASDFSWLYDESGVSYDPMDTQYEQGNKLEYGLDYNIFVGNNSLYAKVHTPNDRKFNLYVLMYYPGFPSVVIPEGKDVYLETYRNFLTNFSGLGDAHLQNDGGFPVLPKEGDFHPDIIMEVEAKYGIDFNFDNWVVYQRAHYDWDQKNFIQCVFDRENYIIFKDYAREKQDIAHEHGVIYVPTGSDTFFMVEGMIEHVDALLVNTWDGWQHRVAKWGYSGGTTTWTPTSTRLGIWEAYMIHNYTSGDDLMSWTKDAADELLKWNPDSSTMYYWQVTDNDWNISDRLDDFKTAIQYFHDKFRHVSMLPPDVERHIVAKAYLVSHTYRYGDKIDLNPGQIDMGIVYTKDLKWDPVPADGCLIPWAQGGIVGHSQTDDMLAHQKIEQAVQNGSGIALSGFMLRRLEEYYEGTEIPNLYKNMFQSVGWTHATSPGIEPHYLTFNGTFDPRLLKDESYDGHWLELETDSTANIIAGEHPYAGLYEADYGAGEVIGYGSFYTPFTEDITNETSATYGDEYFVRLVEKATGKEGSFRLWDVGKTYVYKEDNNTYYALLVERYGFSRNVPLTVYGAEHFRIIDMDTGTEIPNNSSIYLEENSTRLFKIQLGVPSAPQYLQLDVGDCYVNMSWETPSDIGGSAITRYNIYRNGTLVDYDFVPPDQLWYNDTNVINGLTYTYNVTAVNNIGEGLSSTDESTTPMTLPTIPENLQVDAGDSYVNLTWDVPLNDGGSVITGYNIYRSDFLGVYAKVPADQLWFDDTNVINGVTYVYNMSANNSIGEGTRTLDVNEVPMDVPSAPQNLLATAENGFIVLTWSIPTNDGGSVITGYNIYKDGTVTVFETISANQLSYEDHDVTDGVSYTYYVSAINIAGEGYLSNAAEAKAGSEPAVPSNFTATAGDSYVYFNWDIPTSNGSYLVTNYTIYRGTVPGGETLLIILGNVQSYNDTSVVNDVTYYYRISATNDIAEGALSNSISAIPQTPVIPFNEPPTSTITSPSEGDNLEGIIEVSGTSSDADGSVQRIEIRIDDGDWITVSGTSSWTHSLDTTLLSDEEHKITVRAYDGENYSAETEIRVTVANPEEEEEAEPDSSLLWIIIMIIVILLVLVLLLRRIKKKPAPESITAGIGQVVEEAPTQQAAVMFECPLCNTLVNEDAKSCPGCGAIFSVEEEVHTST